MKNAKVTFEVVLTKCTEEEQREDQVALEKAHRKAMKEQPTWEFFGGVIRLANGHKYQVINKA